MPYPSSFKKKVISNPVAKAIAADLKEGGFTLSNLRWLNNNISSGRDDVAQTERNITRQEIDQELGTSTNQRDSQKRKAEDTTSSLTVCLLKCLAPQCLDP